MERPVEVHVKRFTLFLVGWWPHRACELGCPFCRPRGPITNLKITECCACVSDSVRNHCQQRPVALFHKNCQLLYFTQIHSIPFELTCWQGPRCDQHPLVAENHWFSLLFPLFYSKISLPMMSCWFRGGLPWFWLVLQGFRQMHIYRKVIFHLHSCCESLILAYFPTV